MLDQIDQYIKKIGSKIKTKHYAWFIILLCLNTIQCICAYRQCKIRLMFVQHPQSQESFKELQIESLNFPWVQVSHVMYEGQSVCRDHLKEEVLLMLFNHMMENMTWNDQHVLGNVMKDSNLSDLPDRDW